MGSCKGERKLVSASAAFLGYCRCADAARVHEEGYLSAFQYPEAFADHLRRSGSTRAYGGPCWAPWVWWDLDRANDLPAALADTRRLVVHLTDSHAVVPEHSLLVFFSGAKGFHVALATSLFAPEGLPAFHRAVRRFCQSLADQAGATIDSSIYDKVRALRAPNSRHPRTGLHKRYLTVDEALHLGLEAITDLARRPQPFEVPEGGDLDFGLARAWQDAVQAQNQAPEAASPGGTGAPSREQLNRLTVAFIREGALEGERATRLYSAAANLGEFGCPEALVHALLTEPALDSGLPPSEVRRQIACGLRDGQAPTLEVTS